MLAVVFVLVVRRGGLAGGAEHSVSINSRPGGYEPASAVLVTAVLVTGRKCCGLSTGVYIIREAERPPQVIATRLSHL
jgi:hypothetical protein